MTRLDSPFVDPTGVAIYEYSLNIEPFFSAEADTPYWLSVFNDTPDGSEWFWATSDAFSGDAYSRVGDGGRWLKNDVELAFSAGAIPEPSAGLVFGIGCLIVGGVSRRR